jgi:GNAT superfamily N-acetyltransferase
VSAVSQVQVRDCVDSDYGSLVDVLYKVQQTSEYPPRVDVDGTRDALGRWLLEGGAARRWSAVVDGHLVGHVMIHTPGDYLVSRYASLGLGEREPWIEVGKLFASPDVAGIGVGSALLGAVRVHIKAQKQRLVLCVLETSDAAHRLYLREGLVVVGEFVGRHGRNIVMAD